MPAIKTTISIIIFSFFSITNACLAQDPSSLEASFQYHLEENNDEKKIELLISKAQELSNQKINETILYYKYALELAEKNNYLKNALYIAYQLADLFKSSNNYHYALKYYIKYGEIAKTIGDNRAMGVAYYYQGDMFHLQDNMKKAEHYFLKSCEYFKKHKHYTDLSNSYNSLGVLYAVSDIEKALEYYQKGYYLESKYGSLNKTALFLNNIANIYRYRNDLVQAKIKLDSAFSIAQNSNNLEALAFIYCSYAEYYREKKQFKLSESSYQKSIELHQQLSHAEGAYLTLLLLSEMYEESGNYKKAHTSFKKYKSIQDSINKINDSRLFHQQEFEQNLKRLQHKKNIEILNQKRKDRQYRILIFLISFILLSILIMTILKKKIEVKKIQLAKENQSLKENLLIEKLENNNKELTSKAILLGERNELIKIVSEKLTACKPNLKKSNVLIVQEIIDDLNSKINEKQWEEFEQNFKNLHPTFYNNLLAEFPSLSSKDLKLCSFLKLNMTSKEIAQINHMTTNSVEVSRSRLRKKLGLSNSNISFFVFLSRY